MVRFLATVVLALLASPINPRQGMPPRDVLLFRPSDQTVIVEPSRQRPCSSIAEALSELNQPCSWRVHPNEHPFPMLCYRPHDMYNDCPDAMDLLVRTREPIDDTLLKLAGSDGGLAARYRSAWVLIQRGNHAVIPILERMAIARNLEERYLAWHAYSEALFERKLSLPKNVDLALARFRTEENGEIQHEVTAFLGRARRREAVPSLIAAVKSNAGNTSAIHALGDIGDIRAVPVIIDAALENNRNLHIHCRALGQLPTQQTVQFLIDHVNESGAVEALFQTRSPLALPVLRKHLKKLRESAKPDSLALAITEVAVIRLSSGDPREQLLQLAESPKTDEWLPDKPVVTSVGR